MATNRMRQVGILQVLASGICFGFLVLFGKWAFALGLSPGEFLCLRFLTASLLLLVWLGAVNPRALVLPFRTILHCAALGIFGYALFSSFFFYALQGLSASLTTLLLYTYPVIVTLAAWAIFGERMNRAACFALPIVCVGLFLLIAAQFQVFAFQALLFGFLSAVFYSLYILVSSRVLRGVAPLSSTFYIMLFAGLVLSAMHFRAHTLLVLPSAWAVVLGTALIGTLAAMSLFLAGLQKLSSGEVSILSTAEPVTGVILAGIFLGERLQPVQWIGAVFILGGMVLVGRGKRKEPDLV
ncbi:MAG: DMT family transporter [Bdellovibrionota bacterium]